jgi:hypothetical protein
MKFGDMMTFLYNTIGITTTEHALKNEKVQEFIHRNNDKFDLIIAEQFYQEAFLMLAHKYNAPIVTIGKQRFPSTCSNFRVIFILRNFWICPIYEPTIWCSESLVACSS